ncbi:DedA family protein [Paenibacillus taiwanensis]|uniref:DedA family protein n=1 Tax=Paenibacillus taiwanensis TaxID=401638 RepID=UPI0003FC8C67|nr:DedA family protein [Paenibacillus taiwanensis]
MSDMMWVISHYGYMALFVLLALGIVGLPVPDETIMVFVGSLTASGPFHYIKAFIVCLLGSMTGMLISYTVGRKVGKPLLDRYGKWVKLTPQRLAKSEAWFKKYGPISIAFGYFVPGFRHLTCYFAGMSRLKFPIYLASAFAGAVIWVTTFLTLGHFVGMHWKETVKWLHQQLGPTLLIALVVAGLVTLVLLLVRKKKRQRASQSKQAINELQ